MSKVAFYLMSQKGLKVLTTFINVYGANKIEAVVTSKDDAVLDDAYDEIKNLCNKNNIVQFNRKEKYDPAAKYIITISWRWIIDIKNDRRIIVLHDSILPLYRGFNPLVTALINGDNEVGVTALFANEEYDRGDIVFQKKIKIAYPVKINIVIDKVADLYSDIVNDMYAIIAADGMFQPEQQNEEKASYSLWRDEDDYLINWAKDASFIKRFVDSVGFPYKGASAKIDNKMVRIIDAEVMEDVKIINRDNGKIIFLINGCPVVVCGSGLLKITKMISDDDRADLLPLKKIRIRFA